jgi:hypothetical protein
MESARDIEEALHQADRAAAAPYIDYPPIPRSYLVVTGLWAVCFCLTFAIPRPGPLREVAQLMLIAVSLALTRWYHRHRGTWPRGRAPEEIRRVKVTFVIGATVVVCLVAVAFGLAGPWVATPVAVVVMAPALAWYERAYANAAARARARLG